MSHRSVEAGRGLEWFKGGIALIQSNPVPLLVISLLFAIGSSVLSVVPFLGTIAVVLLTPVLGGGLMYALHEQHEGRGAQIEHLFRGFQEPGRVVPLILLGIPALAAGVVMAILLGLTFGAAILGLAAGGADSAAGYAGLGIGALLALVVGLGLALAVAAIVVFAVPRVMLDGLDAGTAMKESLAASLANFGALLVFGLMFVGAAIALMVVSALFGWIPLLGQLLLLVVWFAFLVGWIALSNAGVYLAWRELWPRDAQAVLPPGPPAPPPA